MISHAVSLSLQALHISPFFFFNDTATTEIYTLSLHDALPISDLPAPELAHLDARAPEPCPRLGVAGDHHAAARREGEHVAADRKSTRLNSSHGYISYAVFCLKKKKNDMRSGEALERHDCSPLR